MPHFTGCDILDIFPPDRDEPVRIEFYGDFIERMRDHSIGCLLVVTDAGALAGILTERDLLQKVAAAGLDLGSCQVKDFMSLCFGVGVRIVLPYMRTTRTIHDMSSKISRPSPLPSSVWSCE